MATKIAEKKGKKSTSKDVKSLVVRPVRPEEPAKPADENEDVKKKEKAKKTADALEPAKPDTAPSGPFDLSRIRRPSLKDLNGFNFQAKFADADISRMMRPGKRGYNEDNVSNIADGLTADRLATLASSGVKVNAATAAVMMNKARSDAKSIDYQQRQAAERERLDTYFQLRQEQRAMKRQEALERKNSGKPKEDPGLAVKHDPTRSDAPVQKSPAVSVNPAAAVVTTSHDTASAAAADAVREAVGAPLTEIKLYPNAPDGSGIPIANIQREDGTTEDDYGLGTGFSGLLYMSDKLKFSPGSEKKSDMKGGYSSLGSDGRYHRFSLLKQADYRGGGSAVPEENMKAERQSFGSRGPDIVTTNRTVRSSGSGITVNGKEWKPSGSSGGRVMTDGSIVFGDAKAAEMAVNNRHYTREQVKEYGRATGPKDTKDVRALIDFTNHATGRPETGEWKNDPGAKRMMEIDQMVDKWKQSRNQLTDFVNRTVPGAGNMSSNDLAYKLASIADGTDGIIKERTALEAGETAKANATVRMNDYIDARNRSASANGVHNTSVGLKRLTGKYELVGDGERQLLDDVIRPDLGKKPRGRRPPSPFVPQSFIPGFTK